MQRNDDEIHLKPAALLALMMALAGGNFALTQYSTTQEHVRPDPFTGAEGRLLAQRIEQNERRLDALRSDVNLCLQFVMTHQEKRP